MTRRLLLWWLKLLTDRNVAKFSKEHLNSIEQVRYTSITKTVRSTFKKSKRNTNYRQINLLYTREFTSSLSTFNKLELKR